MRLIKPGWSWYKKVHVHWQDKVIILTDFKSDFKVSRLAHLAANSTVDAGMSTFHIKTGEFMKKDIWDKLPVIRSAVANFSIWTNLSNQMDAYRCTVCSEIIPYVYLYVACLAVIYVVRFRSVSSEWVERVAMGKRHRKPADLVYGSRNRVAASVRPLRESWHILREMVWF